MRNRKWLGLGVVVAAFALTGCTAQNSSAPSTKPTEKKDDDDDHGHGDGPNGGTVFDLGKYHAEFCMDHGKKQATIYIWNGDVKKAVPIAAEKLLLSIKEPKFQVDLKASPQEGDPAGKASRFVATHDNFGKEQEFEGTVSGTVDGKNYAGDFKEEAAKKK